MTATTLERILKTKKQRNKEVKKQNIYRTGDSKLALSGTQNCKRLSISSKRQITIPQLFFKTLGFENEAECLLKDNELIIRPVNSKDSEMFAEQILSELINEGYSGESLLLEFKNRQAKIRPAVIRMLEEADAVAEDKAKYMTMDEVFGVK